MATTTDPNAPTTQAGNGKAAGAPKKDKHPILVAGGKFTELPEDWKQYATPKEDDFEGANLDAYYEFRAERAEAIAKKFRQQAADHRATGGIGNRKVAKQLVGLRSKMNDLLDGLSDEEKAKVAEMFAQG